MSLLNEIAKMSDALSLNVSTAENEIMKQLRKDIRVGISSIKDNLAKLNEELSTQVFLHSWCCVVWRP